MFDRRIAIALFKGIGSRLPILSQLVCRSTGGTSSAGCYTVWLRHLAQLRRHNAWPPFGAVAELGPGDSIGIGLCAILSGAPKYLALDARKYGNNSSQLVILNEIISLFEATNNSQRSPTFPGVWPPALSLEPAQCPSKDPNTVSRLRRSLDSGDDKPLASDQIEYIAPWNQENLLSYPSEIGLVFSQAVLEHVDNISDLYISLGKKLRPGAIMSHVIDFTSHGLATTWHGHWTINDFQWHIIRGRRPYLINRMPWSMHRRLLESNGFKIIETIVKHDQALARARLAPSLAPIFEEDDLRTAGVYVIAMKI